MLVWVYGSHGWNGNWQNLRANRHFFRRRWSHPTPVLLPGKSHGWRRLVGFSPWGHKESNTTERLHFQFSLSCIGEGNGNPLQCSCLENPRDGGAWWAAVYGVTQSRTWLKWLSSSSSRHFIIFVFIFSQGSQSSFKKGFDGSSGEGVMGKLFSCSHVNRILE